MIVFNLKWPIIARWSMWSVLMWVKRWTGLTGSVITVTMYQYETRLDIYCHVYKCKRVHWEFLVLMTHKPENSGLVPIHFQKSNMIVLIKKSPFPRNSFWMLACCPVTSFQMAFFVFFRHIFQIYFWSCGRPGLFWVPNKREKFSSTRLASLRPAGVLRSPLNS